MSEGLGILFITIVGIASMVAFVFIKIMINTTNYAARKNRTDTNLGL